jgi:cell division protein FtsQ
MTLAAPQLTKDYLVARRRGVRQQRLLETLKNIWRYSLLCALVGASFWLGKDPLWELRNTDQIVVTGTKALSPEHIHKLLALPLPLKIFEVEPSQLIKPLLQEAIIQDVQVRRQLWPPRIALTVTERIPVATTNRGDALDAMGVWLPRQDYPRLPLSKLMVVGYRSHQATRWQMIYPLLAQSPVTVHKINMANPHNLILLTAIGVVHLGQPDAQRLREQLVALDQLRLLQRRLPRSRLQYVDLTSPATPQIRLLPVRIPT